MKLFTLLCLDYKQIFTPVLGLQLMKNSANYLKQTQFILFISRFSTHCQDQKLKHEKEQNIPWVINHRKNITKLVEFHN